MRIKIIKHVQSETMHNSTANKINMAQRGKARKLSMIAFAILLLNLYFSQTCFAQAGPVRLKGSGGNTVTEINVSGTWYEVHSFTSTGSATFTPPSGVSTVEYLLVAGGAGGGGVTAGNVAGSGGGGAGGFLTNVGGTGLAVTVQSYSVVVGTGGTAGVGGTSQGGNGGISSFSTISATGGGGGASTGVSNNGVAGGSGGGARNTGSTGGAGTAGQGNNGANNNNTAGGGGGGAGSAGSAGTASTGGAGGSGSSNSITGATVTYAAGGSGGNFGTSAAGTGGTANTGNGGSGASGANGSSTFSGGAGGSGIVIVRYKAPTMAITTQPSTTVVNGSNFAQPVVIQILDGNGVAVSGITVTAAIQSGTGGTLSNTTATTNASGNATFTNLQLSGTAGGSYTLNFLVPGSSTTVISNTINICTTPVSSVTNQTNITCNGANDGTITITASAGTSPYTFSINNGPFLPATSGDTHVFTGLSPNTPYQVKVMDNNGCISK